MFPVNTLIHELCCFVVSPQGGAVRLPCSDSFAQPLPKSSCCPSWRGIKLVQYRVLPPPRGPPLMGGAGTKEQPLLFCKAWPSDFLLAFHPPYGHFCSSLLSAEIQVPRASVQPLRVLLPSPSSCFHKATQARWFYISRYLMIQTPLWLKATLPSSLGHCRCQIMYWLSPHLHRAA